MFDNPAVVATWSPRLLSVLRIVSGYMFLLHGTAKLFGMPHVAMFDGLQVMSLIGFAGVLELVGGALLLAGLFTRPVAFIVSGDTWLRSTNIPRRFISRTTSTPNGVRPWCAGASVAESAQAVLLVWVKVM